MNIPDNSSDADTPICAICRLPVRHNVPRLGASAGWVHAHDGSHLCASPDAPQEVPAITDIWEQGREAGMTVPESPAPSKETITREADLTHIPKSHIGGNVRDAFDRLFAYLDYVRPDAPRNASDPYQNGTVASYSFEDLRRIADELRALDRAGEAKGAEPSAEIIALADATLAHLNPSCQASVDIRRARSMVTLRMAAPRPAASVDAVGGNKAEKAERDAMALAKYASVDAGTRKEETPIYDAIVKDGNLLCAQHSVRTLERELNAKHAELIRWMGQSSDWCHAHKAEVAALTAQLSSLAVQLEEAKAIRQRCLNSVVEASLEFPNVGAYIKQIESALAEKEAQLQSELRANSNFKFLHADAERRLSALEEDKRRLDWRSNCTMFQANEVLRFCGENATKHKGDHELYRAAIDHVMATVPGAFGDRSAISANPRLLSEGGEGK